jgi:cold shock CspA family protein
MQATVATFSSQTRCGTVLLDNGAGLPFDADAFARSGLRLLRLGQRVNIRVVDGRVAAITLATFPLE